jgi:Ubiquitin-conjugating enzyme
MATRASNKRVSISFPCDPFSCVHLADARAQLAKEYQAIQKSPPPYITAHPSEESILLWYYLIEGPPDTPYHGNHQSHRPSLTPRFVLTTNL